MSPSHRRRNMNDYNYDSAPGGGGAASKNDTGDVADAVSDQLPPQQQQQSQPQVTKASPQTEPFVCQFCGISFTSRNLMFKHLRTSTKGKNSNEGFTSCATHIVQTFQETIPIAPSTMKKQQKKIALEQMKLIRRRNKTGKTVQHVQHALWMGDLPLGWTRHGNNYQRLRMLLRAHLPRHMVQPPWIKVVIRKAYRSKVDNTVAAVVVDPDPTLGTSTSTTSTTTTTNSSNNHNNRPYLGYAIVVFRDKEECDIVVQELDGRDISLDSVFSKDDIIRNTDFQSFVDSGILPFRIHVRHVEPSRTPLAKPTDTIVAQATTLSHDLPAGPAGQDPPLIDRLRPLSTEVLYDRIERLVGPREASSIFQQSTLIQSTATTTTMESAEIALSLRNEHDQALECAVHAYASTSPLEIHHEGRLIPDTIRDQLWTLLRNLRWAVPNHRSGLTAERYLVLLSNVTNDPFYSDLRAACAALMQWTDPSYYYSGIAITKNFIASPHIDDRDQTFQYAVSLGNFTRGGELCVDGGCCCIDTTNMESTTSHEFGTAVPVIHVMNTQNRIARVDGRHVHWVRTWESTSTTGANNNDHTEDDLDCHRYSLIFYDTSNRKPTSIMNMMHPSDDRR
jgi:hypothetical protein